MSVEKFDQFKALADVAIWLSRAIGQVDIPTKAKRVQYNQWQDVEKLQLKEMYEQGVTNVDIAIHFGVSVQSIRRYVRMNLLKRNKKPIPRRFTADELNAIELHVQGKLSRAALLYICDNHAPTTVLRRAARLKDKLQATAV